MTPNFIREIQKWSPEYQGAYAEGYEAAKKQFLRKLKRLFRDVSSAEPFVTITDTTGSSE